MTYQSIKESIQQYQYKLPLIVDNDEGQQMVVSEETELVNPSEDHQSTLLHQYVVYTYISQNRVKVNRYYENGIISEQVVERI